jgi:hypothetical protein
MIAQVRAWLANPVLAEWDQSRAWCELASQRAFSRLEELARVLAFRAVPESLVVIVVGVWVMGRIPGGGGAPPWRVAVILAGPLVLALLLPYVAIRSGLVNGQCSESWRLRLRRRTLDIVGRRGVIRTLRWSQFEAFDFGVSDGFQVVKLRLRDRWPFRGRRASGVVAFEAVGSPEQRAAVREVLIGRGLCEEPLGEATC